MSVLNQSGEEQVECPLCMEPLEVDDLNFYPCTCGYQICRFCWHRIRTDENGGLCPACRKAYSENPADFIPLSQEQVAKLKAEKRQRDQQRKAKLSESRKHLASVRVVQRNLVFVVGLPMRLADAEILKRHEYFGKFGKIHKVVINQSTSYAGSQGPSASAYVTYMKSDDALRAIESVNNIMIDGRLIKSSLGTTKYCSHFMKNQPCPKPDCMYLHDFGDPEASFTKEQMHAGKHQEYEKKLHDSLLHRTQNNNNGSNGVAVAVLEGKTAVSVASTKVPKDSVTSSANANSGTVTVSSANGGSTNKENWPQLNVEKEKKEKEKNGKKAKTKGGVVSGEKNNSKERKDSVCNGKVNGTSSIDGSSKGDKTSTKSDVKDEKLSSPIHISQGSLSPEPTPPLNTHKISPIIDDNSSFFSSNTFHKITPEHPVTDHQDDQTDSSESTQTTILTDSLPIINTTEDWAAAFGFARHSDHLVEEKNNRDIVKGTLETFGSNGFVNLGGESGFGKVLDGYSNGYENILDVLANKTNGFGGYKQPEPQPNHNTHLTNGLNGMNGLDQNMSKFFMDFHKNNKEVPTSPFPPNGFNGIHQNGFFDSAPNAHQQQADRLMLLRQKHLEEELMNLSLHKGYGAGNASPSMYQNGATQQPHYMNREGQQLHNHMYGGSFGVKQNNTRSSEDELDFDPFQETQKALAELMANEQSHKTHSTAGRGSQINGVVHNQTNGSHLPPPPGFVQPTTHMNSFGSKILPYLNMSHSQQQINNSTQNNWPSGYNPQLPPQQQQPPHKNLNNTCNDWKVLDPAILTSSRHFPLANMPQIRPLENFTNLQQLGTQQIQQNGGPLRPFEYTNTAFSNFTQQLQPNFNNYPHINTQQNNLNWYSSELNSQISSPPGFRNNQTTKQQEC